MIFFCEPFFFSSEQSRQSDARHLELLYGAWQKLQTFVNTLVNGPAADDKQNDLQGIKQVRGGCDLF